MKRRVRVRAGRIFNRSEGGNLRAHSAGAELSVSQHVFEKFRHVFDALDDGPEPGERRELPPVPGTDDELDAAARRRVPTPSPIILPEAARTRESTAIAAHGGPRAAPATDSNELGLAGKANDDAIEAAIEAAADQVEDMAAMVDGLAAGGTAGESEASSSPPKKKRGRPRRK